MTVSEYFLKLRVMACVALFFSGVAYFAARESEPTKAEANAALAEVAARADQLAAERAVQVKGEK